MRSKRAQSGNAQQQQSPTNRRIEHLILNLLQAQKHIAKTLKIGGKI